MKVREAKNLIYDNEVNISAVYIIKFIIYFIQAKFYKFLMNIFYPRKVDNKRYNVSICAIFKNEAKYFEEWIKWHKIIGIDHFYLYNNNSEDNYKDVLDPFIKEGTVELIEWPYEQGQMSAYTDCVNKKSFESDWIGFIDLDEFIVPIKDNNIKEFLKKFKKNRPAVLLYWQFFGTSGIIERPKNSLITEEFHSCWPKHDIIGKCFFNTNYELDEKYKNNKLFHHALWGKYKIFEFPMVNFCDKVCLKTYHSVTKSDFAIQLNHYFTKSFNEYIEKCSKGDVYFKNNPHNLKYLYKHESLCSSVDYSTMKYLLKLKIEMDNK